MNAEGLRPHPENPIDEEVSVSVESGDLTDMLSELRVLLPTSQLLSAFLITVPFNGGFANILTSEKGVFLATFILSILSLVLLSAPAVQHRVIRPLTDRPGFKRLASRQIVIGAILLGMALTLATQLVLSTIFGHLVGIAFAGLIGGALLLLWWVLPTAMKAKGRL